MTRFQRTAAGLGLGAALSWTGASLGERAFSGVTLRVERPFPADAPSPVETRALRIASDALLFSPAAGAAPLRAIFRGWVFMEGESPVEVRMRGNTPGRLFLDDALVLPAPDVARSDRVRMTLRPGAHGLRAEFEVAEKLPVFRVTVSDQDDADADFEPVLFPTSPSRLDRFLARRLFPWLRGVARVLGVATAALGLWWVLGWPGASLPVAEDRTRRAKAGVGACALAAIALAGLLRVDSVVRQYWGLDAPPWARRAAELGSARRPVALKQGPAERPYFGDPTTYLRFAREMEGFYDAHVREPLFVAATRVGLRGSGGRDIGLSLTSALFSTLLVGATFVMGLRAFGPGVGLVASLLLAVEHDAIALAAEGWRDDTFAFWVVAFAASLLALLARPTFARALVLGGIGGAAALTRITSLSFVLPALAFALWTSRRDRQAARRLALAALIAAALLAPFFLSSRIAAGDALHAINARTHASTGRGHRFPRRRR